MTTRLRQIVDLDRLIHEPSRLMIAATLYLVKEAKEAGDNSALYRDYCARPRSGRALESLCERAGAFSVERNWAEDLGAPAPGVGARFESPRLCQ
jgi:hypothetical protein